MKVYTVNLWYDSQDAEELRPTKAFATKKQALEYIKKKNIMNLIITELKIEGLKSKKKKNIPKSEDCE